MSIEREHECFVCGNDDVTLFDVICLGDSDENSGDDVALLRHCLLCNDFTHLEGQWQPTGSDVLGYLTDSTLR